MKYARSIVISIVVVAGGLVALATPAAATALGNRTFVDNTDFKSFGAGGLRGGSGTITVEGVSGDVTTALLYWNGPTRNGASNAAVNFDDNAITGADLGLSDDNCWTPFTDSHTYWADVTSFVSGDGAYDLSNFTKTDIDLGTVADANGASLIVFFDDGNEANNRDVTMVDGNDSNVPNSHDSDGWDSTINGVQYQSGVANLQLHVSDGQSFNDDAVSINSGPFLSAGQLFDGDSVPGTFSGNDEGVTGNLWDLKDYADISSFLSPGSNDLTLTSGLASDCLSLVVALVDVPSPAVTDLTITKTDGNPVAAPGYGPDPVSSGNVVAYKVEVTNNGPDTATGITVNDFVGESGGTIVGASGTNWTCTIDGTATCIRDEGFDSLASGATAEPITIQVQAPTTSTPTTIDDTATVSGNESDSNPDNNTANESTAVNSSGTDDHAAAFCPSTGCTISTDGGAAGASPDDPTVSTLDVPAGVDPQTITLDESTSATFCGGAPCQGQILTITSSLDPMTFSGIDDPTDPVVLTMIFDKTVKQGSKVYINKGGVTTVVKNCTVTGVAAPRPCLSAKNILVAGGDRAFIILFLEGDPIIGKR